jgi:hypothetical protein
VPCDDGCDRGGDLRCVRAYRGDDSEQRLREAEALAEAIELAREDDARGHGERKRADQQHEGNRNRHGAGA